MATLAAMPAAAHADRPFSARFTENTQGNITIAANAVESCVTTEPICPSVRDATPGRPLNNNDRVMTYIDVDGDPTTFDSSEATLTLPAGARVLFAGLYYGGRLAAGTGGSPAPGPATAVKLLAPGGTGYLDLTGAVDTAGQTYQGFVNVTDQVSDAGPGVYRVANVQAGTGRSDGQLAGWSLVVAYGDPAAPPRNLSVFDGLQNVGSGSPGVTIGLTGFRTPPTGAVNSTIGLVAYEGDLTTTGDGASIRRIGATDFVPLSNAANPANNLFNSSISAAGTPVTDRFPNYPNTLGFDADLFTVSGVLQNDQTSTQVRLTTTGDAYQPGVVTIATDLYAPKIEAPKSVSADVADVGQLLTYTIPVRNTGDDAASGVVFTDAIPDNTTYVANSLTVGGVPVTDAADGDAGEVAGAQVTARLGTLAAAPSPTVPVSFQVRVNADVPPDTVVSNVGRVDYSSAVTGATSIETAPAETRIREPQVDLELGKTVTTTSTAPFGYGPFESIGYRLSVTNNGSLPAPNAVLTDPLPAPMELSSITPSQGTCTGTTCTLGTIPAGATVTVDVTTYVPGDLTTFPPETSFPNTARVTSGGVDTNPDNNVATAEINTAPVADVSIRKTFAPVEPLAGGPVVYTLVVDNRGPSVVDVNAADLLPPEIQPDWTIELVSGGTGACEKGELPEAPGLILGLCQIPRMEVGGERIIQVRGTLAPDSARQSVTNTSAVSPDALDDYGPESNNLSAVTFVPKRVDLAFTKTRLESGPVPVGGETTFRLSTTNTGDGTATGVELRDTLPAGLTPLGPPAGCTVAGQVVTCTAGSVGPGATVSFDVRARAEASAAGQTLTNSGAVVTVSPDLDSSNDTAEVRVPIGPAPPPPPVTNDDLAIRVLAPRGPMRVGDSTRWRLQVTNAGPATATGVKVTATPAGGTILPGARVAQVGCATGTPASCSLDTLAPGASRTIDVAVRPTRRGTLTLTGTVSGNEPETRSDNNRDGGSVTVKEGATSLALSTRPSTGTVRGGKTLKLTITVRNGGRHTARNLTVCQRLPGVLRPLRLGGAKLRGGVPCWKVRALGAGRHRRRVLTVRAAQVTRAVRVTATVRADNARSRRASARVRITSPRRPPRFTG
jgi:uncharacterized repeat protein (TIGR01451 family)